MERPSRRMHLDMESLTVPLTLGKKEKIKNQNIKKGKNKQADENSIALQFVDQQQQNEMKNNRVSPENMQNFNLHSYQESSFAV